MSHFDEIDRLRQIQVDNQASLSRVWKEYAQCNTKLQLVSRREREYMVACDRLRDQKDAQVATLQQCYVNMAGNSIQIEQLNQKINELNRQILAQRRQFEAMSCHREVYEHTVSDLYRKIESLEATNGRLELENQGLLRAYDEQRSQKEVIERQVSTLVRARDELRAENHYARNVQSDYLHAFLRVSEELMSAQKRAQEVSADVVEYLYVEEKNNILIDEVDWSEVAPALKVDIKRAADCLSGTVITTAIAGAAIWVSVEWEPPGVDASDNDSLSVPLCLRIELSAMYMSAPTPPHIKFTRGKKEFPLGHRLAHMLKQYLQRRWSAHEGFTPPPFRTVDSLPTFNFNYDADPRCVICYVADEGGLIAHLVRYAMLRMETYTDFCVVCDKPIHHNRGLVVICGSALCDHSFHNLGVGYDAVGLERTPGTAPELRVRPPLKASDLYVAGESPTVLLMTHVLRYLQNARHHARLCNAGSRGYCAVKEMLQNGIHGATLLVESGDLRDLSTDQSVDHYISQCCLLYNFGLGAVGSYDPGREFMYVDQLPRTMLGSDVVVYTSMASLPVSLLKCTTMTSIDLSNVSHVWEVRAEFLQGCSGLTTIDLSPLSHLTKVSDCFLSSCFGLTSLDLSPLSNVTMIQNTFLGGCHGLTTIDLSHLSNVKEVQGKFLSFCTGLTFLDLSPLANLTELQHSFLEGCTGLEAIDLSPLSKVTVIQHSFLTGCSGVRSVDLGPLLLLTRVDAPFLKGCLHLHAIPNIPPLCVTPPSGWDVRVEDATQWTRRSGPESIREILGGGGGSSMHNFSTSDDFFLMLR